MANLKNPLLSFDARGTLSKAISFTKRRGQNIAEKKPEVPDQKSPAQLVWRHMYSKCAALWHTLSTAEKQDWESLARPKHMTGFAYWQSQCLRPNPGIYLPLQGGTMSGDIDMAKNRILKLPLPTDAQEAARKAEVNAIVGEHSLSYWRLLNRYHFSTDLLSGSGGVAVKNNLYAVPFYSPFATTVTKIGIWVTAGDAGNARLGIYEDNEAVYPGDLLLDCGVVDVTAIGGKEVIGLSVSLSPNSLYWLVYVSDVNPTVLGTHSPGAWSPIGSATTATSALHGHYRKAFVYAPLPDPF
ncbi:unnamed protein product, partial [marine sediment metagenome]